MTVEKCNKCKRIINTDKHNFIFVLSMRQGRGTYSGDLHFCSPECLINFMYAEGSHDN